MTLHAFNSGCNIIGIQKNDRRYGMCCAWAQMIDYDKLTMLLGAQSITAQSLAVGDILGVSALSKGQEPIAITFGSGHSDVLDKWTGIPYRKEGTALLVEGAKTQMVCRVRDILHLSGIENDSLLVLEVLSYDQSTGSAFLSADEV
jgi:flavin reductase (DIM6/NTAB) family NADH-FMN oxidoreductase RutF